MLELIFLGLASWFIPKFFGFNLWIIPIAVGLFIGLFSKGSLGRIFGALFALIITLTPGIYFAILNDWTKIPIAILMGGKIFVGYFGGTVIRIIFTPFRWIGSLFKK